MAERAIAGIIRPEKNPAAGGALREYEVDQYRTPANLSARSSFHERFSANRYGWHRWCFDQLALPPSAYVLELGCGPGELWSAGSAPAECDWFVTLTDLSIGMTRAAHGRLGDRPDLHLAVAEAQALPARSSTFDAVIANHMLYHVPNRPQALAEIQRVLKPRGLFFAATNGAEHMRELLEILYRVIPRHEMEGNARPHEAFSLENGAAQLAPWFESIETRRYEDILLVTDSEALVGYALSGAWPPRHRNRLECFRGLVNNEMEASGSIRITKDAGMFVARRK